MKEILNLSNIWSQLNLHSATFLHKAVSHLVSSFNASPLSFIFSDEETDTEGREDQRNNKNQG